MTVHYNTLFPPLPSMGKESRGQLVPISLTQWNLYCRHQLDSRASRSGVLQSTLVSFIRGNFHRHTFCLLDTKVSSGEQKGGGGSQSRVSVLSHFNITGDRASGQGLIMRGSIVHCIGILRMFMHHSCIMPHHGQSYFLWSSS